MPSPVSGIVVIGMNTGGEVRVLGARARSFATLEEAFAWCDQENLVVFNREALEPILQEERERKRGVF